MIERAILLRRAIAAFLKLQDFKDLIAYQLNDIEWKSLEVFQDILTVPHAFQEDLCAEKTPTLCDVIPAVNAMEIIWKEHQSVRLDTEGIVQAGLDKLDGYAEQTDLVPAYVLALVLNPATKLNWFMDHAPEKFQWAKNIVRRELQSYFNASNHQQSDQNQAPLRHRDTPRHQRTLAIAPSAPTKTSNVWGDKLKQLKSGSSSIKAPQSLEAEIDAYLLDRQTGTSSIAFWQENQLRYPTFFLAAMDILPIQASSVPCECVFSSGKETMTARRNRITPELMEALQMMKFSLRNGHKLDFTGNMIKEYELLTLENEMEDDKEDSNTL